MTKLPVISGRECVKALQRLGFVIKRQEGSHIILRRESPFAQVVVPDHKAAFGRNQKQILRYAPKLRGSAQNDMSS